MKEFFTQCLKELEAVTGLQQLRYWEMEAAKDHEAAKRKVDLCVSGMVRTAAMFNDIPEEKQRKFIQRMMQEDQTYEALNSRTIHKWLSMCRNNQTPQAEVVESTNGKYFDELDEKTKELVNNFLRELKGVGREVSKLTAEQIMSEGVERKDPYLVNEKASGYIPNHEYAALYDLKIQWIRATKDPITGKDREGALSFDEWLMTQPVTTQGRLNTHEK